MEIKHISELRKMMTPEQIKKSEEDYQKYYGIPYGHLEPVYPAIEATYETSGEEYLTPVDLEDFD